MTTPFQRLLGTDFALLAEPLRRLHSLAAPVTTAGRAKITISPGIMPWLLCRLAGLPRPGRDVPVTVSFHPDGGGGEYWQREFADQRYASMMATGADADAGLLVERFRPFTYCHRLTSTPGGVAWRVVKWRFLGLPLPRWTTPDINCFESADGERYRFDIRVVFPFIGPVIHYRGWLSPTGETAIAGRENEAHSAERAT